MSGITVLVAPCSSAHVPGIAASTAGRIRSLRNRIPALADTLITDDAAIEALTELDHCLVALDGADVVGHLGWFEFPTFRRASRRAVWIPEVGLSARDLDVLELLYIDAAHRWADTERQVVSVTLLVGDEPTEQWWVTNGFGRFLHDTVRPCEAIDHRPVPGIAVRAATIDDAPRLEVLDTEHCAHYGSAPVFMVPFVPTSAAGWAAMVTAAPDAAWVADDGSELVGFVRFEPTADGILTLRVPDSVTVTGIFTRPAARGQGLATALLSAGMAAHRQRGIRRVAIDHETTNPEARHFWPHHTTTVAVSLARVLERP
jgi:GNAT superfamily N-acetyltransferase